MNDDKVSVSIQQIENGFVVNRSWCDEYENKDGEQRHDYQSESYYLASLPPVLEKMFRRGKNSHEMGGKEADQGDEFASAIQKMDAGKKAKPEAEDSEDQEADDGE